MKNLLWIDQVTKSDAGVGLVARARHTEDRGHSGQGPGLVVQIAAPRLGQVPRLFARGGGAHTCLLAVGARAGTPLSGPWEHT